MALFTESASDFTLSAGLSTNAPSDASSDIVVMSPIGRLLLYALHKCQFSTAYNFDLYNQAIWNSSCVCCGVFI